MQSQSKNEMFTIIKEYHTLLGEAGLKAAPDKTFFFLRKWNYSAMSFFLMQYNLLQNELQTWKT